MMFDDFILCPSCGAILETSEEKIYLKKYCNVCPEQFSSPALNISFTFCVGAFAYNRKVIMLTYNVCGVRLAIDLDKPNFRILDQNYKKIYESETLFDIPDPYDIEQIGKKTKLILTFR